MSLYFVSWIKHRMTLMKLQEELYLRICVRFFILGGVYYILLSFIKFLQTLDIVYAIQTLTFWLSGSILLFSLILIFDFVAGIEIREKHFKNQNPLSFYKAGKYFLDTFIAVFLIGFLFDSIFLGEIIRNPPTYLTSIIFRISLTFLYVLFTHFEIIMIYQGKEIELSPERKVKIEREVKGMVQKIDSLFREAETQLEKDIKYLQLDNSLL